MLNFFFRQKSTLDKQAANFSSGAIDLWGEM
jgi:hypothetical protein